MRSEDPELGHETRGGLPSLVLAALGVVYGDIGTSPLYAFREALHATGGSGARQENVLGILSLIIWALTIVVTLKYVTFVLKADNRGEGGTLSLLGEWWNSACKPPSSRPPWKPASDVVPSLGSRSPAGIRDGVKGPATEDRFLHVRSDTGCRIRQSFPSEWPKGRSSWITAPLTRRPPPRSLVQTMRLPGGPPAVE